MLNPKEMKQISTAILAMSDPLTSAAFYGRCMVSREDVLKLLRCWVEPTCSEITIHEASDDVLMEEVRPDGEVDFCDESPS